MILLRKNLFFGLIGILSAPLTGMQQQAEEIHVFDLIKNEHACAIDDSKQKTPFVFKEKNADGTPYDPIAEEFIRQGFEMQQYQPFSKQFAQACDLLRDSGYFPQNPDHLHIDAATREDLKILRGPQRGRDLQNGEEPSEFVCLANKVNGTLTIAGKAVLCSQLARPPALAQDLIARNTKINALIRLHHDSQRQNSLTPSFNTLETYLKNAAAGESLYLSFFDQRDSFEDFIRRSKTKLPLAKKVGLIQKFENWLNDNQFILYIKEAAPILMSAPSILVGGATEIFNFGKIFFPNECRKFLETLGFEEAGTAGADPAKLLLKMKSPGLFTKFFKLAFGAQKIADLADMKQMVKCMIDYNLVNLKYMRKKLYHTNKFISALKDTQKALEQIRAQPNGQLLVDLQLPNSDKAKETMELLSSPTFAEDHDNIFLSNLQPVHLGKIKLFSCRRPIHWGEVKLAYKRMCENKHLFIKPLAALAYLDYLMASARLIINSPAPLIRDSNQKAKYCAPTFIQNAPAPSLQITNGWNLFIKDGQRVVLNNVELGVPIPGHPEGTKMIILTGGNGQGKTVCMTMAPYAVLLSQGLGVAPAQQLSHTPYNHLITFMKTETDTSKGESLFRNTCRRGKVCEDTCRNGRGKKLFCGDEIYNGTKHTLAQSTVYKSMERMGNLPNVNGILTTHLKVITRLPASYQVKFVNLKANNHHVEPGIGDFETEEEGLRIIAQELGPDFADQVRDDIKQQAIYEYWEQQDRLDNLVQAARQEYQALRQQAGAPTLDGIIANITDPELRAALDRKINEPSLAGINSIIQRLSHPDFYKFFDLVGHVAIVGQLSSEAQQKTFKDLMLSIMAHCADATATAHSAPWLERIRQIEANIAQEHERRTRLLQEIEALQHVRNDEPLDEQLRSESRTLATITKQVDEKTTEIDSVKSELDLRQKLRNVQLALSQQNTELDDAIAQARQLIQSLKLQPHTQHNN